MARALLIGSGARMFRGDPRDDTAATAGCMSLIEYFGRFHRPAAVYWATVELPKQAERPAHDCGHRHRAKVHAVSCALASGPAASVVRWTRQGLEVHEDAQIALWLWMRAERNPSDAGHHLFARWNSQRVKDVGKLALGEAVTYVDGSTLGGRKHGDMEDQG